MPMANEAQDDPLFKLGVEIGRRAVPAPKEGTGEAAGAGSDKATGGFIDRDGVRCAAVHLVIDLSGARRLDDAEHVERTLRRCAEAIGTTLGQVHVATVSADGGIGGAAGLGEGHVTIRTWPAAAFAAIDVLVAGSLRPEAAVGILQEAFDARQVTVAEHLRGWTAGH
jgi:S-adenosylmethionine decarboxylase